MNDLILSPLQSVYIEVKPNGLIIAPDTPYSEWQNIGIALQLLGTWIEFALGDWLLFGEKRYGEMYSQAIAETGKPYGTLTNYVYVAKAIEISRRQENVSFSHHAAVASLSPDQQDVLLERVKAEKLNVYQLRQEVKMLKHGAANTPAAGRICPQCGYDLTGE